MRNVLVDAGPLIALFDKDDVHHDPIRELLRDTAAHLVTTWPVITETSHMLDFSTEAQIDLYRWLQAGGTSIHEITSSSLSRVIELVDKYRDRPMDLADATLVVSAEVLRISEIVSVDRDFDIYRTADRSHIANIYLRQGE